MKKLVAFPAGRTGSYTVPSSVEEIGEHAFDGAAYLLSVTLPSSLRYVRESAFETCLNISELVIPGSVGEIEDRAFFGCNRLRSLRIRKGVQKIGYASFDGCLSLETLFLPDSVTQILEAGFGYCYSLRHVFIPESVASIHGNAFKDCENLTIYGTYGSAAETFAGEQGFSFAEGGVLGNEVYWMLLGDEVLIEGTGPMYSFTQAADSPLSRRTAIRSVHMRDGVTSIAAYLFFGCASITDIEIPQTIQSIGKFAFGSCTALEEIHLPINISSIDEGAFIGCTKLEVVFVWNRNLSFLKNSAFNNCPSLTLFGYRDSTAQALAQEKNIRFALLDSMDTPDFTLPRDLSEIGEETFLDTAAEVVFINGPVNTIGPGAFSNCKKLRQIHIPPETTQIAEDAFDGCPEGLIIYGKARSTAFYYAIDHGYTFGAYFRG